MFERFFREKSLNDSESYYSALKAFKLDPNQNFIDCKNRLGLQAATHYSQLYFTHHNRYKRFRREIELHRQESNPLNKEVDVIIVLPPDKTIPKTQTRRFLRQSMGLCMSGQFMYVSPAQLHTDRPLLGAKRLYELVKEKKNNGRKCLIISYSFGSAFVRVMLDNMSEEEANHIKGWVNVSGVIFGSPLFHCSDKKSLFNNVSGSQRSFSIEQKYFHNRLDTKGIKTVHLLGLKCDSTLGYQEWRRREALKAWGPNDGILSFEPYRVLEQPVIPFVDQGHGISLDGFSSTFVRMLSSLVSTLPPKGTDIQYSSINQLTFDENAKPPQKRDMEL